MRILKVKDWVKGSAPQFEVAHRILGKIFSVRRLSDGRFFNCGFMGKNFFEEFNEDCIHVKICSVNPKGSVVESKIIEINDYIVSPDTVAL